MQDESVSLENLHDPLGDGQHGRVVFIRAEHPVIGSNRLDELVPIRRADRRPRGETGAHVLDRDRRGGHELQGRLVVAAIVSRFGVREHLRRGQTVQPLAEHIAVGERPVARCAWNSLLRRSWVELGLLEAINGFRLDQIARESSQESAGLRKVSTRRRI